MKLPSNNVLKALLPLYWIPESVENLYLEYFEHHVNLLVIDGEKEDICVLWERKGADLLRLIIIQVYEDQGMGMPCRIDK